MIEADLEPVARGAGERCDAPGRLGVPVEGLGRAVLGREGDRVAVGRSRHVTGAAVDRDALALGAHVGEDRQSDRSRVWRGRLAHGRKRLADVVADARPALENLAVGVGQDQLRRRSDDLVQQFGVVVEGSCVEDRRVVGEKSGCRGRDDAGTAAVDHEWGGRRFRPVDGTWVGDGEHGDRRRPRRVRRQGQRLFVEQAVLRGRDICQGLAERHRLADSRRRGIEQRPGLLRPWRVVAPIGEVRLQDDVAGTEQPGDGRQGRGLVSALLEREVEGLEEVRRRIRTLDGLLAEDFWPGHDPGPDRVEQGAPVVGGEVLARFDEHPRGVALGVEITSGLGVVRRDLLGALEVLRDGASFEKRSAVGHDHRRQRTGGAKTDTGEPGPEGAGAHA